MSKIDETHGAFPNIVSRNLSSKLSKPQSQNNDTKTERLHKNESAKRIRNESMAPHLGKRDSGTL